MKKISNRGVTIDATGAMNALERLRLHNLGGKIKKVLRQEIKDAKKEVVEEAKKAIRKDPRKAVKAVKTMVYKGGKNKMLGGNISILPPRGGARSMSIYQPGRPGGRSGIRRRRNVSYRTRQIRGYTGADRYFILHWIDAGADRSKKRPNRGIIAARHFFTRSAKEQMEKVRRNVIQSVRTMVVKKG